MQGVVGGREGERLAAAGRARGNGDIEAAHSGVIRAGNGAVARVAHGHRHGPVDGVARGAVQGGGDRDARAPGVFRHGVGRGAQGDSGRGGVVVVDGSGCVQGGGPAGEGGVGRRGQAQDDGLGGLGDGVAIDRNRYGLSGIARGEVQRPGGNGGVVASPGRRSGFAVGVLHRHGLAAGGRQGDGESEGAGGAVPLGDAGRVDTQGGDAIVVGYGDFHIVGGLAGIIGSGSADAVGDGGRAPIVVVVDIVVRRRHGDGAGAGPVRWCECQRSVADREGRSGGHTDVDGDVAGGFAVEFHRVAGLVLLCRGTANIGLGQGQAGRGKRHAPGVVVSNVDACIGEAERSRCAGDADGLGRLVNVVIGGIQAETPLAAHLAGGDDDGEIGHGGIVVAFGGAVRGSAHLDRDGGVGGEDRTAVHAGGDRDRGVGGVFRDAGGIDGKRDAARCVVIVGNIEARRAAAAGAAVEIGGGERTKPEAHGFARAFVDDVVAGRERQGRRSRGVGCAGEGDGGRARGQVRARQVRVGHAGRRRVGRRERVIAAECGGAAKGERHGDSFVAFQRPAQTDGDGFGSAVFSDVAGRRRKRHRGLVVVGNGDGVACVRADLAVRFRREIDAEGFGQFIVAVVGDGDGDGLAGVSRGERQVGGGDGGEVAAAGGVVGGLVRDCRRHQGRAGLLHRQAQGANAFRHRACRGGEGEARQVLRVGDGAGGRIRAGVYIEEAGAVEGQREVVVAFVGGVLPGGDVDGAGARALGNREARVLRRRRVVVAGGDLVGGVRAFAAAVGSRIADGHAAARRVLRQGNGEDHRAAFRGFGVGDGDEGIVVVDRHGHRAGRADAAGKPTVARRPVARAEADVDGAAVGVVGVHRGQDQRGGLRPGA